MKCWTVLLTFLTLLLLTRTDEELLSLEDPVFNFCRCNCADLTEFDIPDPPFATNSNCVRIKATGDFDSPGGYLFVQDTFGQDHTVFHDRWFTQNKRKHRWLSGGFWRIYYPWVNASGTGDGIPFVIQNILTREYLTVANTFELTTFRGVFAGFKLVQRSLWKPEMKRGGDGIVRWTFQNHRTGEWLLQHPSAIGNDWWKGRVFAHNRVLWDQFREGNLFWVHPCY